MRLSWTIFLEKRIIYFSFTDHRTYFDIMDFMDFHQSSVKVFWFGSSENFTMSLSCCYTSLTESNLSKQTLHHSSAVDFGATFRISPPFLKKPITSPHIIHCEWMCGGFYYKFAKVNFALWRHVFNISDLTFRDSFGSASNMYVFSVRQTSQNFAPAVYTPVFARILHSTMVK